MPCIHRPISPQDAVWLPPHDRSDNHTPAQKRVYCLGCGNIKYQGSDKAKRLGYFTNLIARINEMVEKERKRGVKGLRSITVVQKRLMVREMESDDTFSDTWSSTGKLQIARFKKLIKRHCPMINERLFEAAFSRR